jgi:cyclohexyl-isocyanide hydratase
MDKVKIVFLVYPKITQLDFAGPAQLLGQLPGVTVESVWKDREPIATDSGFGLVPTGTLADCREADIICVPGGIGCHDVMDDQDVLAWLKDISASARFTTSVCTGSLILAAAGLLEGYRATSHWLWREYLALFGAIPTDERVVFDGTRVTGAGVTAGLDFGLALAGAIRGGNQARLLQLGMQYDPAPPFDCGSPAAAGEERVAQLLWASAKQIEWRSARIREAAARMKPPSC